MQVQKSEITFIDKKNEETFASCCLAELCCKKTKCCKSYKKGKRCKKCPEE